MNPETSSNLSPRPLKGRFDEAPSSYKFLAIISVLAPFLIYIGTARNKIPEGAGEDVAVTPSDGFIQAVWVINVLGLVLVGLYASVGTESYRPGANKCLRVCSLMVVAFVVIYSALAYAWTAEYSDSKDECVIKRQNALKNSSWYLGFATLSAVAILLYFLRAAMHTTNNDGVLTSVLLLFPVILVSYTAFAMYINFTETQEYHLIE